MGKYHKSFRIQAPVDRLWELLADPNRLPEWNGAFDRVKDATGRLDEVGSTYTQVMRVAGLELTGDWTITAVDAPHRREFAGSPPGLRRLEGVETFEEVDGATQYTLEMTYTLLGGPVAGALDRLFGRPFLSRVIERNIEALRSALEA